MQEQIARSPKAALALVLLVGSLFLVQIGALITNVLARGPVFGEMGIVADTESDKVGATAAEFRVDESGAATYSIPLYAVPGTAGVAPKLSLNYSSQGGYGPLGKGWSIGGLSSITRCRATREAGDFIVNGQPTDGSPAPVNFTASDRYCLDGQRLIPAPADSAICPAVGGMTAENLRTEIESFQRVCAYSPSGGGAGVAFFTVDRKDGSTSWYGDRVVSTSQNLTYNGYVNSTAPGKEAFALAWAQTRFQDSTGNYIDYVYWQWPGEQLLSEVRYTGKTSLPGQSVSHAPYAKLVFDYSLRSTPQQAVGYVAGGKTTQSRRLQSITSCASMECGVDDQARHYSMSYNPSPSNSGLETLVGVTECRDGTAAVCLPTTTFEWSQAKHELATSQSWVANYFGSTQKFEGFKLGDIDGDGRQDMVWLKDGSSGETCPTEHIMVSFGELDTNGRQGFSAAQMTGCTPTELQTGLGESSWQLFDYTGDGREDLFVAGGGAWLLYPSQGRVAQPFNMGMNLLDGIYIPRMANATSGTHPQLTDLNGDGLMDVIYQTSGYRVRLMERSGANFVWGAEREVTFEAQAPEPCPEDAINGVCSMSAPELYDPEQFRLNDFNGDAASDLLFTVYQRWMERCDEGWPTCRSTEVHAYAAHRYWFTVSATSATTVQFKRQSGVLGDLSWNAKPLVGDINGDGLTDLVYRGSPYDHWRYALNTGNGFLASVEIGPLPRPELVKLVDINGDGRSDIVFVNTDAGGVLRYVVRYALANGGFGGDMQIPGGYALPCHTTGCDPNGYAHIFTDLDADGALDYFTFRMQSNHGEFYLSQPGAGSLGKPRDVITSITNGLGARTELTYAPMTNSGIYLRDYGSRDGAASGRGSPTQDLLAPMYVVAKASSSSPQAGNPGAMSTLHYRYAGAKVQSGGRGFLGFREISTIDPNHANGHIVTTTTYAQTFPFVGMPLQTTKRAVGGYYSPPACLEGGIRNECYNAYGQTFGAFGGNIFSENLQSVLSEPTLAAGIQAPLHPRVVNTLEDLSDPYTAAITSRIWTRFEYASHGNVSTTLVDTYTGVSTHVSRVSTANDYAFDDPTRWRLGRLSRSSVTHSRPTNPGGAVPDVTRITDFRYDMSGAATGQLLEERSQPGGPPSRDLRKVYTLDEFGNRRAVTICNSEIANCTPNGLAFRPASRTAVHRYSASSYDAQGRFPQSTTELFWDGAGAVPRVTQQVISRNIFGDVTEARDVNNVTAMATTGSLGRAFYTWSQSQPGAAAGDSAGGVESWTTYRLCSTAIECPAGAKFRQQVVAEGAPRQWTYFDVLGRPVMKAAETFNTGTSGKDVSATCTHYEASGKPLQTSNPFFVPGTGGSNGPTGIAQVCMAGRDWNVTTFDLLGRAVKSQLIQSNGVVESEVSTSYTGLTTTIVGPRAGMQTVQTRNGKGELTLVRDSVNTPMGYYYYADGSLWAVHRNAGRGVVSNGFQYDVLGRKTGQDDPDSGRATFEYNALGELLAQVSNNERIENEYDARGRVWRKRVKTAAGVVESESTFDHDTAPNGIGQLAREQITGQYTAWIGQSGTALQFNRTYQYDGMGRPASSTTQIDGTNYPTAVQYDALGRASKSQDATGNWSKTEYTARGFAAAVCFSDVGDTTPACATPWQRTREIDAWGHVLNEVRSGSGQLPITRQYHPVTGRIERICADKPGGPSNCDLVEEGYAWDKAGNLSTHQKEGRYLEAFEYDGLNRLWVGYALNTNGTQHAPWDKLTYWAQFDAFGNVCAKTQGAASGGQGYVYGGLAGCGLNDAANSYYGGTNGNTATSPHQVQTAGGASYSYDARGNQTFKDSHDGVANDRTIRYSVDDKAYEILKGDPAAPSQRTRFWYGPDGSRYKRGDGLRRTLYVGNVEIFIDGATTTLKRNIGGFLLQTIIGGAVGNQYLFHDQLGSVVRITDPLGNRLHNMDFAPSGERRNFDDPAQYNGTAPPLALTTRGFTGHEHVDGQNVIHMNGRIYDPQLGRFLQADPVIQSPGDVQSWNAYTYVFNNPLAYTDPTGMISQSVRMYGAMAIALVAAVWTGGASVGWFAALSTTQTFAIVVTAAFASGAIATQSLKGGLQAAFGAALTFGITYGASGFWEQVAMQAVSGGIIESLQGGNFGNGFLTAGISAAAVAGVRGIDHGVARTVAGAIVGGTISEATGGKFANGAVSGAIQGAMATNKTRAAKTSSSGAGDGTQGAPADIAELFRNPATRQEGLRLMASRNSQTSLIPSENILYKHKIGWSKGRMVNANITESGVITFYMGAFRWDYNVVMSTMIHETGHWWQIQMGGFNADNKIDELNAYSWELRSEAFRNTPPAYQQGTIGIIKDLMIDTQRETNRLIGKCTSMASC